MAKIFYDHLVISEELTVELDKFSLSEDDKEELIRLIDENLHQEVLHTILEHLPEAKQKEFLEKFYQAPSEESLLDYLKAETRDIEEKIKETALRVKKELLAEIQHSTH